MLVSDHKNKKQIRLWTISIKKQCPRLRDNFVSKIKALFSTAERIGSAVLTHHLCVYVHCTYYSGKNAFAEKYTALLETNLNPKTLIKKHCSLSLVAFVAQR